MQGRGPVKIVENLSNTFGLTYWRTPRELFIGFGRRALRIRL